MQVITNSEQSIMKGFDTTKDMGMLVSPTSINHLLNSLYSKPIISVFREYLTNAIEANQSSKTDKKVLVQFPNKLDCTLIIRDYGPGLDEEEVNKYLNNFFSTSKDKSNEFIGGFGLGSKAALALTDSFNLISIKDNIKTEYVWIKEKGTVPKLIKISSEQTHLESGLIVLIPYPETMKLEDKQECELNVLGLIDKYLFVNTLDNSKTYQEITTEDNYVEHSFKYIDKYRNVTAYQAINNKVPRNSNLLSIGGICYPNIVRYWYPFNFYSEIFTNDLIFVFDVPIGLLELPMSREHIICSIDNTNKITKLYNEFEQNYLEDTRENRTKIEAYKIQGDIVKDLEMLIEFLKVQDTYLFPINNSLNQSIFKKLSELSLESLSSDPATKDLKTEDGKSIFNFSHFNFSRLFSPCFFLSNLEVPTRMIENHKIIYSHYNINSCIDPFVIAVAYPTKTKVSYTDISYDEELKDYNNVLILKPDNIEQYDLVVNFIKKYQLLQNKFKDLNIFRNEIVAVIKTFTPKKTNKKNIKSDLVPCSIFNIKYVDTFDPLVYGYEDYHVDSIDLNSKINKTILVFKERFKKFTIDYKGFIYKDRAFLYMLNLQLVQRDFNTNYMCVKLSKSTYDKNLALLKSRFNVIEVTTNSLPISDSDILKYYPLLNNPEKILLEALTKLKISLLNYESIHSNIEDIFKQCSQTTKQEIVRIIKHTTNKDQLPRAVELHLNLLKLYNPIYTNQCEALLNLLDSIGTLNTQMFIERSKMYEDKSAYVDEIFTTYSNPRLDFKSLTISLLSQLN